MHDMYYLMVLVVVHGVLAAVWGGAAEAVKRPAVQVVTERPRRRVVRHEGR